MSQCIVTFPPSARIEAHCTRQASTKRSDNMDSCPFLASVGQHRCTLTCPRALVGRVIGKHGTTVKGIQMFSQAIVDIDQATDEATITIQGSEEGTQVAKRMILDIVANSFKGFALLRGLVNKARNAVGNANDSSAGDYVFCPGKGIFPRRQVGLFCVFVCLFLFFSYLPQRETWLTFSLLCFINLS